MSMNKIRITLALLATIITSFTQGKIAIGNDATHLIVDQRVPIPQTGGWDNLTMQLWGGLSAGSMTLQTSFVGAAIGNPGFDDGRINNTLFALSGIPGGQVAFLQLRFFDTAFAGAMQYGQTPVFNVQTGSFLPISIVLAPPGGNSTWSPGYVKIAVIPEPKSLALAGLAAVSLLMLRRR